MTTTAAGQHAPVPADFDAWPADFDAGRGTTHAIFALLGVNVSSWVWNGGSETESGGQGSFVSDVVAFGPYLWASARWTRTGDVLTVESADIAWHGRRPPEVIRESAEKVVTEREFKSPELVADTQAWLVRWATFLRAPLPDSLIGACYEATGDHVPAEVVAYPTEGFGTIQVSDGKDDVVNVVKAGGPVRLWVPSTDGRGEPFRICHLVIQGDKVTIPSVIVGIRDQQSIDVDLSAPLELVQPGHPVELRLIGGNGNTLRRVDDGAGVERSREAAPEPSMDGP